MERMIEVQDAVVNTAVIQVKTLTIGKRQVTLAVFRQLQEEALITGDATFAGTPWGRVNYHQDCDARKSDPHIHVVWQSGAELRRSVVWQDSGEVWLPRRQRAADVWNKAAERRAHLGIARGNIKPPNGWASYRLGYENGKRFPVRWTMQDGRIRSVSVKVIPLLSEYVAARGAYFETNERLQEYGEERPDWVTDGMMEAYRTDERKEWAAMLAAEQAYVQWAEDCTDLPPEFGDWYEAMCWADKEWWCIEEDYRARYRELLALDQLFIAV